MSARIPVTFHPRGQTAWVVPGTTVLEASHTAGVPVQAPCGGRGVCGSCGVRVLEGTLAPADAIERDILKSAGPGVRLACRAKVVGPVRVKPIIGALEHGHGDIPAGRAVAGVDVGTTSVSAAVLDADTGRETGRSTVANKQVAWGADVLSRVSAALAGESDALREAAETTVLEALEIASGGRLDLIERVVIAGNPAMSGLLAGSDVSGLAGAPFEAPSPTTALCAETRMRLAPGAEVLVLEPIGAFVGGDALAGIVATGLSEGAQPALLVDIGTNAEVVLVSKGRAFVASAPAGPAFEGAGIRCGGPAAPGGVVSISATGDSLSVETIGGAAPQWLTGAGLVSAVALLRRCGAIADDGRMVVGSGRCVAVTLDADGVAGVDLAAGIRLDQKDVRALQLAKGAVAVAIGAVLDAAGVRWRQLKRVVIAGAFGGALDAEDLVELGVISSKAASAVEYAGNTSLHGAASIAMDAHAGDVARRLARDAVCLDLAADDGFAARLMSALELSRL